MWVVGVVFIRFGSFQNLSELLDQRVCVPNFSAISLNLRQLECKRTDGRTDRRTDRQTDTHGYIDRGVDPEQEYIYFSIPATPPSGRYKLLDKVNMCPNLRVVNIKM